MNDERRWHMVDGELVAFVPEAERDALRAQVKALTEQGDRFLRHIHVSLHRATVSMSNCRMCGALAVARDAAATKAPDHSPG
jgi:hypothetical protein